MGVTIPWVFLYRLWDGAGDICESGADWDFGCGVEVVRADARSDERDIGVVALGGDGAVSVDRVDRDCSERLAGCLVRVERGGVRGGVVAGGVVDIGTARGSGVCDRIVMMLKRQTEAETEKCDGSNSSSEEPNWTSRDAMRTPALWLLALATGMMFFMHAGSNTHAAAFFQDQGLGAVTAGVSISLNAIFLGISSLFWGRIVERVPARFVMAAVALNLAIGAFLFTLTDTTVEALAFSAFFGFRAWRDAGGAAGGVCGLFWTSGIGYDTGYH